MRDRVRALAVLALVFISSAIARATVIAPADLNELTISATAVVYARIADVRAVMTDDRRRIETVIVAEAVGYMKGDLGRTIVFKVPGGQVGAYRTVMVGAPSFNQGDEVVLFLGTRGPALPYLVGFSQGVYRVRLDERTATRMVTPPPAVSTGAATPLKRGTRTPMALEAFAAQVRALAQGGGAR